MQSTTNRRGVESSKPEIVLHVAVPLNTIEEAELDCLVRVIPGTEYDCALAKYGTAPARVVTKVRRVFLSDVGYGGIRRLRTLS
jgi:hypothetical protein